MNDVAAKDVSTWDSVFAVARRRYSLRVGVGLAVAAVALGALVGYAGVAISVVVLAALVVGLWMLSDLRVGLWAVVAVITLLPFGALPVKVVFTPTFLDLAMLAVVGVYVAQWMSGRRRMLALTPLHALIVMFAALAVFAFVVGMPNGPLTSNLVRHFAELLLSMLFTFIVVDYVEERAKLDDLARAIIVGGTAAAALGLALYFMPESLAERALSALRVFNYPAGGVLRYIEDNPENAQRAISTSVDPNMLGGLLAMVGGLLAPQLAASRPLWRQRWPAYLAFGVVVACLALTYSRGAMAALLIALAAVALARYRKLLWLAPAAAVVIMLLPATSGYVERFLDLLHGRDLATQMRLGEFKDAFILIGRYPVLGVGFAGTPEVDIYLGVSSAYLLMAEEMGLVGLTAFLAVVAGVYLWSFSLRHWVAADDLPVWLGVHAGLAAALAVGLGDHYFFNLDFHPASALFWIFVGLCLAATRLAAIGRAVDGSRR